jgi:2-keto-4-pentenoate hydratase
MSVAASPNEALEHDALSEALYRARIERKPIPPLTDEHPSMTALDAYQVQQGFVRRLEADGDRVVGWKLGLTSAPMQAMFGVSTPDYGPVLASFLVDDGAELVVSDFISPKAEAEIAVLLNRSLSGPGCTALDVAQAVAGYAAAIEIVDSRIADWKIKLPDTISDLASMGAIAVSSRLVPPGDWDLRLLGMAFTRDGEVIGTGAGAAALGSPLNAVAWLVRTLHGVGVGLEPGQFVMTGSLHAAVPMAAGSTYRADFDRLGPITLRTAGASAEVPSGAGA